MQKQFWYNDMVNNFINLGERIYNVFTKDFGVPIANLIIPSMTSILSNNQVLNIPVEMRQFHYFDEFRLNYKFSDSPRYVQDSIEFFLVGDVFHRTQSYCAIPYDPKTDFKFNYTK
jgi:hypothetical protein